MTREKRQKIKALMDSPASTENEKEICRKLLKDNPETETVRHRPGNIFFHETPRSQASGNFWSRAQQAGAAQDDARRQRQAAQGNLWGDIKDQVFDEAAQRQAAQSEQRWQAFKGAVNNPEYLRAQRTTNTFLDALAQMLRDERKK